MNTCSKNNYIFYCSVVNFKSSEKELDFGDFKIRTLKQGPEAAEWRKELGCKGVPSYVLIMNYSNYEMLPGDISGYDKIIELVRELLLLFRLFKEGDINFNDFKIVDAEDASNSVVNLYNQGQPSVYKYSFNIEEIERFNAFRKEVISKSGYKNIYFEFALNHFMSGVDRGFHGIRGFEKIIDYVIALESIFLIDNKRYFLRRAIAERVAKLLKDEGVKDAVKYIYDERSNIVRGNYIGIDFNGTQWSEKKERVAYFLEIFERTIRRVFIVLFDFNFSTKDEAIKFMEQLYSVPPAAFKIMESAQNETNKLFNKEFRDSPESATP